jgi:hypothetical protein
MMNPEDAEVSVRVPWQSFAFNFVVFAFGLVEGLISFEL